MFKKFFVGVLVAVIGLYALTHTKVGRHVASLTCTAVKQANDTLDESIPVDTELQRLRSEVAGLDGEIDRNRRVAAKEKEVVDNLRTEEKDLLAAKDRLDHEIQRVKTEIKGGATVVAFNGREVSAEEINEQFEDLLDKFETVKVNLETKKQQRGTHEGILQTQKDQIRAMYKERDELARQIDKVEADYRKVQLQQSQAEQPSQFDRSKLAEIKESLTKVRARVNIEKNDLDLKKELKQPASATTPAKGKTTADLLRRADLLTTEGGK